MMMIIIVLDSKIKKMRRDIFKMLLTYEQVEASGDQQIESRNKCGQREKAWYAEQQIEHESGEKVVVEEVEL